MDTNLAAKPTSARACRSTRPVVFLRIVNGSGAELLPFNHAEAAGGGDRARAAGAWRSGARIRLAGCRRHPAPRGVDSPFSRADPARDFLHNSGDHGAVVRTRRGRLPPGPDLHRVLRRPVRNLPRGLLPVGRRGNRSRSASRLHLQLGWDHALPRGRDGQDLLATAIGPDCRARGSEAGPVHHRSASG